MKGLFVGLILCLLASLLLVAAETNSVSGEDFLLLATFAQSPSGLLDGVWTSAAIGQDGAPWFCAYAGETEWKFPLQIRWWKYTHRQLRLVRSDSSGTPLLHDGDADISMQRFSRFSRSQGAVRPPG